jgi:hypothetical protein
MKVLEYIWIFLFPVLITGCSEDRQNVVAVLENHPITTAELRYWMLLEKANVYSYFYRKHQVADGDDFWTTKLADEVPLERLKETALAKVKRCKVQQILARQKGIIHTAHFDEIVHALDRVNKERMKRIENGEPVYGPTQFTTRTYFSHVFDKMVIDLKSALATKELKFEDQQQPAVHGATVQDSTIKVGALNMFLVDKRYEQYIDSLALWSVLDVHEKVYRDIGLE